MPHILGPPPQLAYSAPYDGEVGGKTDSTRIQEDSLPRLGNCYTNDLRWNTCPDIEGIASPPSVGDKRPHSLFFNLTTDLVPAWPSLQFTCALPLGCAFRPFCDINVGDVACDEVQCASTGDPFRCLSCQAFVNPYFSWLDEGMKVRCNLCAKSQEVTGDYFSSINGHGVRYDAALKPELQFDVVDFVPPNDIVFSSEAPAMIFVIDCSYLASSSGFLESILRALQENINALPLETEIAFIIFNQAIHFVKFELSRNGSPSLITVADVDDPFVPDPLLCVSPHLLADQLVAVWDLIRKFSSTANPNRASSCGHSALIAATEILGDRNSPGTVVLFQASTSKIGRSCTDELSKYCKERNICIDLFACSDSVIGLNIDILSTVISELGGEQYFVNSSDLAYELTAWIKKPRFYNCLLRVRGSKSLVIDSVDFWARKGADSVAFPRLTPSSTIGTCFSITETVSPGESVYLQLACLYTRSDGTRLIRVINVKLTSSPQAVQVFKHAHLDTIGFFLIKQALAEHRLRPNKTSIKDILILKIVAMLHAYRVNCAVSSGSGQLILPDSLKVLPLMISGFLKQVGTRARPEKVSQDEHILAARRIEGWNVREAYFSCLTRILCVHPHAASELVPALRTKILPSRIYMVDLDKVVLFYVGREVSPAIVAEFFGLQVADWLKNVRRSPIIDVGSLGGALTEILNQTIRGRKSVRFTCILASSTIGEIKFSNLLIEDRLGNESGYIDWLCLLHRLIQDKIDY
jgi:protein transport protein SEC24